MDIIAAMELWGPVIGGGVGLVAIVLGGFIMFTKIYRKVDQGKALIVNTMRSEPDVTFTGRHVIPVLHRAEVMDISVKTIELDRAGKAGLICQDNIRADIQVTFFVRVNKTKEDVLKVAQAIGCSRASDKRTLEELFTAKFSEALKTVGKQLDFVDLYTKREEFKDRIVEVIGRDLNGYVLEDAAIDYLEQTPLSSLDRDNILDAQGIRKITELTAIEHISTNLASNNEQKLIRKQDVETKEAVLELDRQQADAEARQDREIRSIRAQQAAEVAKVEAEERLRAETARIKTDEDLAVQEENKNRQVQVAGKNRERVIGIETERVEQDRALAAIQREREVELQRIDKEKALEKERKEIQDVIRLRVIVEKAVAQEEEAIKELRMVEEASRIKQAAIITAEGEAEQSLVKDIKHAEAGERSAKHKASEMLMIAEADLQAADKHAQAKIRLAEGVRAEEAAAGLAHARVKEAEAVAFEKQGLAEAVVKEADAGAREKQGFADARIKEADAVAEQKFGAAQAEVIRDRGKAEAEATQKRLVAEAAGLLEKAKSMEALDEAGRGHEEYRIKLEKEKEVQLAEINARREVAEAQARTLAEAFKQADIDIIGGDGQFFDRIVGAVSYGKAMDELAQNSDSGKALMTDYIDGKRSLPHDISTAVAGLGTEGVQELTISAFLAKLMAGADGDDKGKLQKLIQSAKRLGIGDQRV